MRRRSSFATWSDSRSWAGPGEGRPVKRGSGESSAMKSVKSLSPQPTAQVSRARCSKCSSDVVLSRDVWRCPCLGALDLELTGLSTPAEALQGEGFWRYLPWLPVNKGISIGERESPLVRLTPDSPTVLLKLEGLLPTGSFKDRGAAILVSWLLTQGVEQVVEDSSGNAGAALAAYCARAGIGCHLYVPASTSVEKLVQAETYGARVTRVLGPREAATTAALKALNEGSTYASHLWHPLFQAGTETFAFELWEQLGRRGPDVIVFPVGAGSLLLGAWRGFRRLREAGLLARMPRLYGVQASSCAPLATELLASATQSPDGGDNGAAEGIMVVSPPRARAVSAAAKETGGSIVAISEGAIWDALARLGRTGVYVEPTSALAVAALEALLAARRIHDDEEVVVAVTGIGLKATSTIRAGSEGGAK